MTILRLRDRWFDTIFMMDEKGTGAAVQNYLKSLHLNGSLSMFLSKLIILAQQSIKRNESVEEFAYFYYSNFE